MSYVKVHVTAAMVVLASMTAGCSTNSDVRPQVDRSAADGAVEPVASVEPIEGGSALTWSHVEACAPRGGATVLAALNGVSGAEGSLATDQQRLYAAVVSTDGPQTSDAIRFEILAVPLPCGRPSVLVARSGFLSAGLVYASGNIYWIDDGGVFAMPAAGGSVRMLAPRPPSAASVGYTVPGLAVRGDVVYWADVDGTVSKVRSAGGAVTTLASGPDAAGAIAVDDAAVYWSSVLPPRELDGGNSLIGRVLEVSIDGGPVTTLATDQEDPDSLLLTATDLYWATAGTFGIDAPEDPGAVMTVPLSGGTPAMLATGQSAAVSLVQAGNSLYWLDRGAQGVSWVQSLSLASKSVTTVVPFAYQSTLSGLVTSSNRLYWARLTYATATLELLSMPVE